VAGRLVRRVVPALASGLAVEHRVRRPGGPVVPALEDAGRLDADEDSTVGGRYARDLGHPAAVLVGEPLARLRPGLAEIGAAPDRGAVPLARCGRVDGARTLVVDRVVNGPALAVRPS